MSDTVMAVEEVRNRRPYRVPRAPTPIDLHLDGNEGVLPPDELLESLGDLDGRALRDYPSTDELRRQLADRLGIEVGELIVTAGADDAIDRVCRAVLEPGKNAVIPVPTFEMIPRFAALTGAEVRRVERRRAAFPVDDVIDATDDDTSLIVVISPNNPTGRTAQFDDIAELAARCPQSLILVDHAYVEFSAQDITERAPEFDNVVVTRTLSKAWGLAGLRVGYGVAPGPVIEWMHTVGGPYPVSRLSLAVAGQWLRRGGATQQAFVDRVITHRQRLHDTLDALGIERSRSRANFAFARVGDGLWWRDAMAGMGIGIRAFPGRPKLRDAIRFAVPGERSEVQRLEHALETVADPGAILFDLDGVFADVSDSYRRAIMETCESFGVSINAEQISAIKARGNANNDWQVTRELLVDRGVDADLEEVTRRFEARYQGAGDEAGLWRREECLVEREFFEQLQDRDLPMAIVTGRPRRDARRFVEHFDIGQYFDTLICMEDAPLKPDPAPVEEAMERLGIDSAWFIGDTPDDMRAGRAAGVLPLGVIAPAEDRQTMSSALLNAGAGRVLDSLDDLLEIMP